jgi:carbamoyl-phosphate synthase large subunit
MIGVDVNAINITERTESNSNNYLKKLGTICACRNMYFYLREKEIAQEFGFPLVRPSFTLEVQAAIVYKRRF